MTGRRGKQSRFAFTLQRVRTSGVASAAAPPRQTRRRSEHPNRPSVSSCARGGCPASPRRSPWPPRPSTPETLALDTKPPARWSRRHRPATHPGTRSTRYRVSGYAIRYSVLTPFYSVIRGLTSTVRAVPNPNGNPSALFSPPLFRPAPKLLRNLLRSYSEIPVSE